jgi:hypothetical protein
MSLLVGEDANIFKDKRFCWVWWLTPVIPDLREVKIWRITLQSGALAKSVRPYLENN